MRVVTFLLSLALSLGCIVLNFLGFNGTLSLTQYMLISIAAEVLLAFLLGYFMFRTYANRKSNKKNLAALEETNAKMNDLQQQLAQLQSKPAKPEEPASGAVADEAQQATAEVPASQTPTADSDTTTLFKTPLVDSEDKDNNKEE